MRLRVYYEDTDCGNVVYYANYLKYMERSRTEFLRDRGIDLAKYHASGILFTVIEAHLQYKAPARYDDLLDLASTITECTPASLTFSTLITRASDGAELVSGTVRLACVKPNGRPGRIPEEIKKALVG